MDNDIRPGLIAGGVFGAAVILFGLGLFLRAEGIWETKVFGVAEQNAQTEVFEHSQAYKAGNQRDLDELYLSYTTEKDPEAKKAVLSIIRHRTEGMPAEQVPANIRSLLR